MIRLQLLLFFAGLGACAAAEARAEWAAEIVPTAAAVTEIRQVGDDVYIWAGRWFSVADCADGLICEARQGPPAREQAPDDFPDGTVAEADNDNEGIRSAWFAEPTDRYPHGALGDPIEAGALVVQDVNGRQAVLRLGRDEVFEDIEPRIADFVGNGQNEVLVIRSSSRAGSSVVVYRLLGSTLAEIDATAPIGRPNRWLNIAGIADFTGNRHLDIAVVKTPHIGGTLEILALERASLRLVDRESGFSNHVYGSTELGMSAIADINGDGIVDLTLPDAERGSLRLMSVAGGTLQELARVPLDGQVATAIGVLMAPDRPIFFLGLESGQLVAVRFQEEEED